MKQIFILALFIAINAWGAEIRMALETYNGWDLPFAKFFQIAAKDPTQATFPSDNYLLAMNPSAFFSVIFVDTSLY